MCLTGCLCGWLDAWSGRLPEWLSGWTWRSSCYRSVSMSRWVLCNLCDAAPIVSIDVFSRLQSVYTLRRQQDIYSLLLNPIHNYREAMPGWSSSSCRIYHMMQYFINHLRFRHVWWIFMIEYVLLCMGNMRKNQFFTRIDPRNTPRRSGPNLALLYAQRC